ncbi:MAG: cobalamin-binding protein [Gemmatimonadaceae bacterium]|jgi:iron complex transport system substrate-binding protein|nr:cobalamin-binding protein [Gemmatimonadaceae bacterium]
MGRLLSDILRAAHIGASALLVAACAREQGAPERARSAIVAVDDLGDTLRLVAPAARVVSLVPAVTDVLLALDAGAQIVGRTRYDVDPRTAALPDVGGGLDPNIEAIVGLRPDLVITWANDKRQETAMALRRAGVAAFAIAQRDTADVYRTLRTVATLMGRERTGVALADSLRAVLQTVASSVAGRPRPRVFYIVGNDPPMTAGPRTFIGQLIDVAGGQNVFADSKDDWPTVSMEAILARAPDMVVLPKGEMSEADQRLRAQPGWRDLAAVREGRVVTIDANLANRPGPGMAEAARRLRDLLHPSVATP